MEYGSRGIKWYWAFLLIVYCVVVVGLLLYSNPYLYSTKKYQEALVGKKIDRPKPVPSPKQQRTITEDWGPRVFESRFSLQRHASDASGFTRNRTWVTEWDKPFIEGMEPIKDPEFTRDEFGFYISGSSPWLYASEPEGELRWSYRFEQEDGLRLTRTTLDKAAVYVASNTGKVLALDKEKGRVIWLTKASEEIASPPLIVDGSLYLVMKKWLTDDAAEEVKKGKEKEEPQPEHVLARFNRKTGEIEEVSSPFIGGPSSHITMNEKETQFFIVSLNKVHSINKSDLKTKWTRTLPDPGKGPLVLVNGQLYVSTEAGKVLSLDSDKGKKQWETDLESPAASAPTYAPIYDQMAVLTQDKYLHMVDMGTGERKWRFDTRSESPFLESWSLRLSGTMIQELSMRWKYKGWVIFAPCVERRICIFNPQQGQIVGRILLKDKLRSMPFFEDEDSFYAFVESDKAGHYRLTRIMEKTAYLRKMREREQENSAAARRPKTSKPSS